jgi:hypothetical protein
MDDGFVEIIQSGQRQEKNVKKQHSSFLWNNRKCLTFSSWDFSEREKKEYSAEKMIWSGIQGLVLARQALYHLRYAVNPIYIIWLFSR